MVKQLSSNYKFKKREREKWSTLPRVSLMLSALKKPRLRAEELPDPWLYQLQALVRGCSSVFWRDSLAPDSCPTFPQSQAGPGGRGSKSSRTIIIAYLNCLRGETWLNFFVNISRSERTLVLSELQLEAITFWLPFILNLPTKRQHRGSYHRNFMEPVFPLKSWTLLFVSCLKASISVFKGTITSIFLVKEQEKKNNSPGWS